MPLSEHGYEQAPYIAADKQEIQNYNDTLEPLDFASLNEEGENMSATKFCDSDGCEI